MKSEKKKQNKKGINKKIKVFISVWNELFDIKPINKNGRKTSGK